MANPDLTAKVFNKNKTAIRKALSTIILPAIENPAPLCRAISNSSLHTGSYKDQNGFISQLGQ
jgi:hypothetical protein